MLYSIGGILELIKGSGFKNKKAAGFGSYGWSGEAPKKIGEELKASGFDVVDEAGLKQIWIPDEDALKQAEDWGRQFAEKVDA